MYIDKIISELEKADLELNGSSNENYAHIETANFECLVRYKSQMTYYKAATYDTPEESDIEYTVTGICDMNFFEDDREVVVSENDKFVISDFLIDNIKIK